MSHLFTDITVKAIGSVCCTAISWLVGGYDMALAAILVLMSADFILGILLALINGTYSRNKFLWGCAKFLLYGIVIAVSNMVDITIEEGNFPSVLAKFREFVVFWFAVTEFISISKHLNRLGLSIVPKKLIERLESFRDNYDPLTGRVGYGHNTGHSGYPSRPMNGHMPPRQTGHPVNTANTNEDDIYG